MPNFPFTVGDSLRIGSATISATGNAVVLPTGTQVGNQSVATSTDVSTGGGPKITNLQVTSNVYVVLDDTAVELAGGFIKLTGTNFVSGCMVYVASTPANSTTFVSTTEVRAALPATAAGTYPVYLVNPDGGTAIRVPGVTFSASPAWQTASSLGEQYDGVVLSLPVVATDATVYTLSSGSLPPGLSLNSNTGVISGTVTGVANDTVYSFTITATDAQLQDSPRTFTVTITVSDPYFKLTTLLLGGEQGNTIVRDSSTNNFNLTVFGDSRATNFTPYNQAWSVYFDGTGDYLQVPYSATNDLGTGGNWTVELWFYMPLIPGDAMDIIGASNGGGNVNKWFLAINMNTSFTYTANRVGFFTYNSADRWLNAAYTWAAGTWYHIAAVYDSTNTTLYVNGQSVGSMAYNASSSSSGIRIGSDGEAFKYFTGYISNTRVVKGTALYTANFTPATTTLTAVANTSLLTCHANRFLDASTNNFTITRNGDAAVRSFNPFGITNTGDSGSMYFDGTGDYLSSSINSIASGSTPFTLEAWIYPTTLPATSTIFGGVTNISEIQYGSGGISYNKAGVAAILSSGTTPTLNAWNHIAVVRNGANNSSILLNGIRLATTASDSNTFSATTAYIGSGGATQYCFGHLSNFRFVVGTAVYDPTQTTYTVPAAPLTAIANTQLLTLQYKQPHNNHSFQDSSANQLLITRSGNASQGTFSPFSLIGWSNYLGGSTSYLLFANANTANAMGTGNWTVEAWLYPTTSGTDRSIFDTEANGAVTTAIRIRLNSSNQLVFYVGGVVASGGSVPANTWTHIAVCKSSGSTRLFVNGSQVGTTYSDSNNYVCGANRPIIGVDGYATSTLDFVGYISNLRSVKGQALYTSNFTPSTSSLTTTSQGATAGNVSLLSCQSNRFSDNSNGNFAVTIAGSYSVQAFSPFAPAAVYSPTVHGGSAYFDGTGDYLTVSSSNIYVYDKPFTFSSWVYGTAANFMTLLSWGGSYGNFRIFYTGGNTIQLWDGPSQLLVGTPSTLTINQWFYIVVQRDANNLLAIYHNGVLTTSTTNTGNFTAGTATFAAEPGGGSPLSGYMSGCQLVLGAATYTSGIPTAPPTGVNNKISLLLNFTDAAIVDRTGRNVVETVADAKSSSQQVKYGNGAMSFDGTGDVIAIPDSRLLDFGSSDWTIEFWIYRTVNATHVILTKRTSNAPAGMPVIYANTSNKIIVEFSSQTTFTPTNTISLNTWTHVAIVRSGSGSNNVKQYLNGTVDPTTVSWTTLSTNTSPLYIGGDSNGNNFTGYIDDIRITQFARYTANFTPPTGPHRLK